MNNSKKLPVYDYSAKEIGETTFTFPPNTMGPFPHAAVDLSVIFPETKEFYFLIGNHHTEHGVFAVCYRLRNDLFNAPIKNIPQWLSRNGDDVTGKHYPQDIKETIRQMVQNAKQIRRA